MTTAMIYFDTLQYVKTLKNAGIPEAQAEAFAMAQKEVLSESLDTTIATKADIVALKSDITELKAELKSDIKLLNWMMGVVISGVMALVLKAFF